MLKMDPAAVGDGDPSGSGFRPAEAQAGIDAMPALDIPLAGIQLI